MRQKSTGFGEELVWGCGGQERIKDDKQFSSRAIRWIGEPFTKIKNNGGGPGWVFVGMGKAGVFCWV